MYIICTHIFLKLVYILQNKSILKEFIFFVIMINIKCILNDSCMVLKFSNLTKLNFFFGIKYHLFQYFKLIVNNELNHLTIILTPHVEPKLLLDMCYSKFQIFLFFFFLSSEKIEFKSRTFCFDTIINYHLL